MAADSTDEAPIRIVTVTLTKGTRDQFFDQLKRFADVNAFAIRIAPTRPDVPHFLIQMWREDINGTGTNALDPEQFRIAFYKNDNHPLETETVNQMIFGLEQAVGKVAGATVSEEK